MRQHSDDPHLLRTPSTIIDLVNMTLANDTTVEPIAPVESVATKEPVAEESNASKEQMESEQSKPGAKLGSTTTPPPRPASKLRRATS